MPWPGDHPVRRLRHQIRRAMFARHPFWRRAPLKTIMTLGWPLGAVWETGHQLVRMPVADRPTRASGWISRGADMLAQAWSNNVPPRNYVAYRLHDPRRRDRIARNLYEPELAVVTAHLNRLAGAVGDDVQDKARFAELCRAHGLPCIPTLAVFRNGSQCVPSSPFLPDAPDLWVKDLAGSRGSGAARWRREGAAYRHAWNGASCSPAALVAQWAQADCIVQPCLENHPSLAPLSDGSLVVFRIITGIDCAGCVTVVDAMAQLPYGGPAGRQIFAAVGEAGDLRNPRLRGRHPIADHPDTGAVLAGAVVPFWRDAIDLVVRAHGSVPEFARFIFLGWDVAITDDGPLLIETNHGWGEFNHQLGDGVPLGDTALTGIALEHLEGGSRCG
jgi:hypothetical protein